MKTKQKFLILAMFTFVILATGCAKPPIDEMNSAAEAVAVAENDINAVNYASGTLSRAKAALANMYEEASSKNYDLAKSFAAEAIAMAELAIKEGQVQAIKVKEDSSAVISTLKNQVKETEQLIKTAKENGLILDYELIENEFDATYQIMVQACEAFKEEKYNDSLKLGNSVRSSLDLINYQLSEAAIIETKKK